MEGAASRRKPPPSFAERRKALLARKAQLQAETRAAVKIQAS